MSGVKDKAPGPVTDGRKLDHHTLEELRLRAVAAVVERGHSPEVVIDVLGLSRSCIYAWLDSYRQGGWEALRARPIPGRPPELEDTEKAWLQQTVLESTPENWGYDTVLWSRAILVELIAQRYQVQVSEVTVGRYLQELGLSPQVPDWQAREQDLAAVQHFLEVKFPAIAGLAVKLGAIIYFLDEAGAKANEHRGRTWGLVGQRPLVESTGQRFGLNMISAVSPEGDLRFKVVDHSLTSQEVIDFLNALLRSTDRPIIVLADHHQIHFSATIRRFAHPHRQRLKLYSLPAYSPECNPDEGVWSEVKPHGLGRQGIKDKADFKSKLYRTLQRLQKQTQKVISFFGRTPACESIYDTLNTSGYL